MADENITQLSDGQTDSDRRPRVGWEVFSKSLVIGGTLCGLLPLAASMALVWYDTDVTPQPEPIKVMLDVVLTLLGLIVCYSIGTCCVILGLLVQFRRHRWHRFISVSAVLFFVVAWWVLLSDLQQFH